MHNDHDGNVEEALGPDLEARIRELEQELPQLHLRHGSVFAMANAWAERYDRLMAHAPPRLRPQLEARLTRIGIRWGVMPGARVTTEFRAIDVEALMRARLRAQRGVA
jgi:hypothetical protein